MRKKIIIITVGLLLLIAGGFVFGGFLPEKDISEASANANLRNGLVAYYKFDETSWNGTAGEVIDSSAYQHQGTAYGGASTTPSAVYGRAGTFDGSNDELVVSGNADTRLVNDMTYAVWIYYVGGYVAFEQGAEGESTATNVLYWLNCFGGNIQFFWETGSAGTNYSVTSPQTIPTKQWIHITVTRQQNGATDDISFYYNGELVKTFTGQVRHGPTDGSSTYLRIGDKTSAGGYANYSGRLDDLRIYNRVLSASEIATLAGTYKLESPTKTGLVGYWNMDANDINGTTVYDKSGNNYNGTGVNITSADLTEGKIKQALDFDGSSEYITANTINPSDPHHITMSAWIKKTAFTAEGGYYNDNIMIKGNDSLSNSYLIGTDSSDGSVANARACVDVFTTGPIMYACSDVGVFVSGKWHHIVGVINGQNLYIYVDGVLKGQDTFTGTLSASDNTFWIGRQNRVTYSYDFAGQIDDARIYNYSFTAQEVTDLYNSAKTNYTASAPKTGLVGYWNMDAGDIYGTTVYDKSGNNNHGTGVNITSADIAEGKVKQAFDFNGSNEQIYLGDNIFSNSQFSSGSISVWAQPLTTGTEEYVINFEGVIFIGEYSTQLGRWSFQLWDGGSSIIDAGAKEAGRWIHLAMTWDGTNQTIYLNGAQSTSTIQGSPNFDGLSRANRIGAQWNSTFFFNGKIDDVRMYNRALSAEEVTQLYESTSRTHIR
ncbi:LamG domain-containing protein [Patescibacteria group bacterium]|nr:LamG domain-containing protein [Patescibacteria group bacterium]